MLNENDLPLPQNDEPCVALDRDEQLYDYYNGVLVGDAARDFEAHLLDCFACRQKVTTLDMINATLKSELLSLEDEPSLDVEIEVPTPLRQHVGAETEGRIRSRSLPPRSNRGRSARRA